MTVARRAAGVVTALLATLALAACALTPGSRGTAAYPLRWQPATSLPPRTASLAFATSAPNVGYACTVRTGPTAPPATPTSTARGTPGPSAVTPSPLPLSHFVYVTADGGTRWTPLATPFPQGRACRVYIAALDPRDLFVAMPSGPEDDTGLLSDLWRSRDSGATWQQLGRISQPGERFSFASVAVVGQRIVAEVASIGIPRLPEQIYASGDDGMTWQQIGKQLNLVDLYAAGNVLYLDAASSPSAEAAAGAPGSVRTILHSGNPPPAALYRSTDAGQTWARVSVPYPDVAGLRFLLSADGAHQYGVGLIPASTAYGADADAVIVTRDGGATWSRIDAPPTIGTPSADLLPDGTIIVQSLLQATQPAGGATGEIFRLHPDQPGRDPSWELLGLGPYVTAWQVARSASSASAPVRLWGVTADRTSAQSYVYADLP